VELRSRAATCPGDPAVKDVPPHIAALGGTALTVLCGFIGAFVTNVWGEYAKTQGELDLERTKLEIALATDALNATPGDDKKRIQGLYFLAKSGLLPSYKTDIIEFAGEVIDADELKNPLRPAHDRQYLQNHWDRSYIDLI
jgi:hypothetical protein